MTVAGNPAGAGTVLRHRHPGLGKGLPDVHRLWRRRESRRWTMVTEQPTPICVIFCTIFSHMDEFGERRHDARDGGSDSADTVQKRWRQVEEHIT